MSSLHWITTVAMLLAAIGFVVIPLRTGKRPLAAPVALVALLVPLTAVGFYALLGSPHSATVEKARDKHNTVWSSNDQAARAFGSVASLVDGLRTRLEREPDDAGGWLLLAQSYDHLGRRAEAIDAYKRARSLGKSDLDFEAQLFGPGLDRQPVITVTGPALRGHVRVSRDAAAQVRPTDTVFIFAKESPAHRMPVVALRKPATDLPIDFILTDKEMMVPGRQLSDFEELVVTAKISRSGNAADDSQGLEAWSKPVSPVAGEPIELHIATIAEMGGAGDE